MNWEWHHERILRPSDKQEESSRYIVLGRPWKEETGDDELDLVNASSQRGSIRCPWGSGRTL